MSPLSEKRSLADLGFPSMPGGSLSDMAKAVWEAMKAPGKAYGQGMTPDEMIKAGNDFALNMGVGGSLVPKPTNSLGIFGGRMAKTANLEKLAKAEQFEKAGVDPDTIWKATGWGRGKDGKWRFEIDDSKATLSPDVEWLGQGRLGGVYDHPELLKAYPELRNTVVKDTGGPNYGWSDHKNDRIGLNFSLMKKNKRDPQSTLLHEIQHRIQDAEGFAKGNNAQDPIHNILVDSEKALSPDQRFDLVMQIDKLSPEGIKKLYKNAAGEVEARTVQARMAYNKLKRAIRSPWRDEDIPRQAQIPFGFRND